MYSASILGGCINGHIAHLPLRYKLSFLSAYHHALHRACPSTTPTVACDVQLGHQDTIFRTIAALDATPGRLKSTVDPFGWASLVHVGRFLVSISSRPSAPRNQPEHTAWYRCDISNHIQFITSAASLTCFVGLSFRASYHFRTTFSSPPR